MPNESSEQGTVRYIRCPSCGTPNPAASPKCSRCGNPLGAEAATPPRRAPAPAAQQVTCPKCRKALPAGSKFCGYCGSPISAPAPAATPKAPTPQPPAAAPPGKPAVAAKVSPPPKSPAAAQTPLAAGKAAASKVSPPPPPPTPSAAPTPKAAQAPPAPASEGTVVFTGLRVPKLEASFTEVKPDGSLGKTVRVTKETFVGRGICEASYPNDALLSPTHCSVRIQEGKLLLKDQNSQNGTFVKQRQDSELAPGDVFLLGREIFRLETQSLDEGQPSPQGTMVMSGAPKLQRGPLTAKLQHIQLSGEVIEEFKLEKPETTIGRSQGDLVFKNDPYMSGTHARIVTQPGRFLLQDLRSRNGIYRRIRAEAELKDGDEFFLGEQLFRVELKTS